MSFASVLMDRFGVGKGRAKLTYLPKYVTSDPQKWFEFSTIATPQMCKAEEDFLLDAGATLPVPWGTIDVSSSGSPTLAYVADTANGVYKMQLATTTEAENIGLYWADQLVIDIAKKPIMLWRASFTPATMAAADKLVMGLIGARGQTASTAVNPDDIALSAWFMLAGANTNIYTESDDGATDTDDKDTGLDYTSAAYRWYAIDCADLSNIQFWTTNAAGVWKPAQSATHAIAAASGNVQPYFELIKASAANKNHSFILDYVAVAWERE